MIQKTMKYIDFDGNERTETHRFNLTKAEVMEMELSYPGGLTKMLENIISAQSGENIIEAFKMIIKKSYGVKSPDGRRFIKSDEIFAEFEQTEAYSDLFIELALDAKAGAEFINGIVPQVDDKNSQGRAQQGQVLSLTGQE